MLKPCAEQTQNKTSQGITRHQKTSYGITHDHHDDYKAIRIHMDSSFISLTMVKGPTMIRMVILCHFDHDATVTTNIRFERNPFFGEMFSRFSQFSQIVQHLALVGFLCENWGVLKIHWFIIITPKKKNTH
jgi:hypothetical protein